jgi:hypothetical protein
MKTIAAGPNRSGTEVLEYLLYLSVASRAKYLQLCGRAPFYYCGFDHRRPRHCTEAVDVHPLGGWKVLLGFQRSGVGLQDCPCLSGFVIPLPQRSIPFQIVSRYPPLALRLSWTLKFFVKFLKFSCTLYPNPEFGL